MTQPRCPAWLVILLLLGSAVGFVAGCLAAALALGTGGGSVATYAAVASPVLILACTAAGTAALRRDRFAVAALFFAPPLVAGVAILWMVRR